MAIVTSGPWDLPRAYINYVRNRTMETQEETVIEEVVEQGVLANPKHVRFSELMWYDPNYEFIVGGAGGIGSWLCLLLSRAGYHLHVYDMDTVDETNLGGQLYGSSSIGLDKTAATAANISNLSGSSKVETYEAYDEDSMATPIMFSAFDNMKARKAMFANWKEQEDRSLFIDGRMLAEAFQIFAVLPGKEEEYEKHLFEDSEVEEQPCSAKATSHCGAMISSMMMSILSNHISNIRFGANIREVPFRTTFEIPLLTFNLEHYDI